jgi:hypothetical protein
VSPSVRRIVHRVCLVAIAALYVASVPWYRSGDQPLRLWLGLPDWVAVALLCYVGVALLNAVAWSVAEVQDAPTSAPAGRAHDAPTSATAGDGRDGSTSAAGAGARE